MVSTPDPDNKKVPFRRVVTETVDVDPRLTDNSFEAKVNAQKLAKPRQLHVITICVLHLPQASSQKAHNFGHLLLNLAVVTLSCLGAHKYFSPSGG